MKFSKKNLHLEWDEFSMSCFFRFLAILQILHMKEAKLKGHKMIQKYDYFYITFE